MVRIVVEHGCNTPDLFRRPMLFGKGAECFRGNLFDRETRAVFSGDQWELLKTQQKARVTSRPVFPMLGYRAFPFSFKAVPKGPRGLLRIRLTLGKPF